MVEKDGILQEMTEVDRIKALAAYPHFRWYLEQLKERRKVLSQLLSTGFHLTEKQIRMLQLEIRVMDFFLVDPFAILDHAALYEQLDIEEQEKKVENR